MFDVVEFHSSITEESLSKALDFAANQDDMTVDERNAIMHAKNSLLTNKQQVWQKITQASLT